MELSYGAGPFSRVFLSYFHFSLCRCCQSTSFLFVDCCAERNDAFLERHLKHDRRELTGSKARLGITTSKEHLG